ncbi:MAG: hypothetical protein AAF488_16410 [Planctomycetota bacterium]
MRTRGPAVRSSGATRSRGAVSIWLALAAAALIAATIAVEPKSATPSTPLQDTIDGAKPGMKIDDPNSLENEKPPADVSRLVIGYGTNNYGYIDVCGCKHKKIRQGSITRRSALIKQLRVRVPEFVLIDGGNTLFGRDDRLAKDHERPQLIEKAKVLIESYNRMGYRAMTFGHFDLSLGLDTLKELLAEADFPCVCANFVYAETGETVFPPFVEIEAGGVKVGVLGLTNTLQPHFLASKAPGTAMVDTLEAARRWVPELRERNDAVVVLSQNSLDFNQKLAREVDGIDFILDPHFKLAARGVAPPHRWAHAAPGMAIEHLLRGWPSVNRNQTADGSRPPLGLHRNRAALLFIGIEELCFIRMSACGLLRFSCFYLSFAPVAPI